MPGGSDTFDPSAIHGLGEPSQSITAADAARDTAARDHRAFAQAFAPWAPPIPHATAFQPPPEDADESETVDGLGSSRGSLDGGSDSGGAVLELGQPRSYPLQLEFQFRSLSGPVGKLTIGTEILYQGVTVEHLIRMLLAAPLVTGNGGVEAVGSQGAEAPDALYNPSIFYSQPDPDGNVQISNFKMVLGSEHGRPSASGLSADAAFSGADVEDVGGRSGDSHRSKFPVYQGSDIFPDVARLLADKHTSNLLDGWQPSIMDEACRALGEASLGDEVYHDDIDCYGGDSRVCLANAPKLDILIVQASRPRAHPFATLSLLPVPNQPDQLRHELHLLARGAWATPGARPVPGQEPDIQVGGRHVVSRLSDGGAIEKERIWSYKQNLELGGDGPWKISQDLATLMGLSWEEAAAGILGEDGAEDNDADPRNLPQGVYRITFRSLKWTPSITVRHLLLRWVGPLGEEPSARLEEHARERKNEFVLEIRCFIKVGAYSPREFLEDHDEGIAGSPEGGLNFPSEIQTEVTASEERELPSTVCVVGFANRPGVTLVGRFSGVTGGDSP